MSLAPKSAEAHHRLGRVLQAQGRLAEAGVAYRRALGLDREYVAAMVGLGTIDAVSNRPEAALKWFDDAIEIDPRQAEAHLAQARVLEALGRPDEALAAYFRAMEFQPTATEARLRVATLQLARGQPDQALARLDALVEQDPDNAEARHARGRAHLALGHLAAACDDLKFAAARLPERPDVHYHLALALAARNQNGPALKSPNAPCSSCPATPRPVTSPRSSSAEGPDRTERPGPGTVSPRSVPGPRTRALRSEPLAG